MKRSKFSLSHYRLFSCDMGELVPIGLTEVLPGDSIQQSTSMLLRVSPLLAPVMHPVVARIHHWFVPTRLIHEDWEDFITGGPNGIDTTVLPTIDMGAGGAAVGSLADYLGVPPSVPNLIVSAFPFRAYARIWSEMYRDQDLQTELVENLTSGPDTTTPTDLQHVNWEKDIFTTARPWPQKGIAVTIPLGTSAPVISDGVAPAFSDGVSQHTLQVVNASTGLNLSTAAGATSPLIFGSNTGLTADLANAVAPTVAALRTAIGLQKYAEARARYGSRYTEYLRYLGIKSSDARLQRPEYLGGGKQTIQFSEVVQTGPDSLDTGVADLKGHGIGAMRSNRYRRFFEEHGYIVSVLSVKPRTMYAQGIARTWTRQTKEDYFQRELQHIGQQELYNRELYAAHTTPDGIFGYQDRYDEYRRSESGIAGDFRTTLDHWHYARIFASDPALNADFVKAVPTKRVNEVQSADVLWVMANHSIQARRMVAKTGTPGGFN